MSYLVLARKWRPRSFAELVGQEHVVKALTHALDSGRLHHAFLFAGTRGVGKTTIARLVAKSLNCETGVSATPCGRCAACLEIDAGRFVDLIEVDAASRTKVDDTRELLDNVQYAPTRGALQGVPHRRGAHAVESLIQCIAEDARRAAAAREISARHDRAAKAADHSPVALPAVQSQAAAASADRGTAAAHSRGGRDSVRGCRAHAHWRARPRAACAMR